LFFEYFSVICEEKLSLIKFRQVFFFYRIFVR